DPSLMAGAPPQDEGMSEAIVPDEEEDYEEEEYDDPELAYDAEEAGALEGVETIDETYAPRGRRGDEVAAKAKDRPRFVQFLVAVWAELQRVQWPDRQALTTLTGVVLGFVLIMGGYLGLLDAIF